MADGVDIVKDFLKKRRIKAEILEFKITTETVSKAAEAAGVDPGSILKTLFMKADNMLITVLICGLKRIDYNKVKRLLGVKKIRFLYPDEVSEYTPFKVGGISPLFDGIYEFTRIMDKSCLDNEEVILGGGDIHHLVKLNIKDLIEVLRPRIADVSR